MHAPVFKIEVLGLKGLLFSVPSVHAPVFKLEVLGLKGLLFSVPSVHAPVFQDTFVLAFRAHYFNST